MTERRKIPRNHLVHYLRLFDRNTNEVLGNMVDISVSGIRLISEGPVLLDKLLEIRMDFPEEIQGKHWLTFDAVCVWCRIDQSPNLYLSGCEFKRISEEDLAILNYLIHLYQDEDE